jgi:hypothetical protein
MTPIWKSGLNLAEIVRCQFGWQYDGSEARNIFSAFYVRLLDLVPMFDVLSRKCRRLSTVQ